MIRLLPLLLLCSCGDLSHTSGETAAARMGLPAYVSFVRHGKEDTAALFYWQKPHGDARWWIYHPTIGSHETIYQDFYRPPLLTALMIDGATGPLTLKWNPKDHGDTLVNGCLPTATQEVRLHGGSIATEPGHAYVAGHSF